MSEETVELMSTHTGEGHEAGMIGSLSIAARDVLEERQRQILEEGFTHAHDDAQADGAIARAAACYARGPQFETPHKMGDGQGNLLDVPVNWPWHPVLWKPRSRREDLVRGAAMMLAEIERIDRAEAAAGEQAPEEGQGI